MTTPQTVLARWMSASDKMDVEIDDHSNRLWTLHFTHRMEVNEKTDADDIAKAWKKSGNSATDLAVEVAAALEKSDMELLEDLITADGFSRSKKDYMEAVNGALIFHFYCDVRAEVDLTGDMLETAKRSLGRYANVK